MTSDVAVVLDQAGAEVAQLGDQLVVEARARERDVAVLERVGHAADAVVLLDEQVLALDQLARRVLRRREEVLDHLEHVREGRQVKTSITMPLMPGAMPNLSVEWRRCMQQVAIEEGLALLLQAERV